ncbi:glycosyl hydrolase family 65 protein [Streptomyces acidicola]|uniref:Glycoside hydrolase family 65 protein n=1 Tax=Streptomyces acidicola TaxID=2596892 RepID=A0A5N8WNQ5_9ACTN|nr:glycosyl hydrolase family 65 protein [Streptomyces acidicola]MPY48762.1 glycoside hydrolase family 65 protein [Streptomyces acidicola]
MNDPTRGSLAPADDAWTLTTDGSLGTSGDESPGIGALVAHHPAFTGNGCFAARVPAAGNGFAETPVRTQFHVAGLYTGRDGGWSRKASLPAWSTLDVGDGSGTFNAAFTSPPGGDENVPDGGEQLVGGDWAPLTSPRAGAALGIERYRQCLDLRTGVITTEARWTSPAGRVTDVRYEVFTDRSRPTVAVVSVTVTPHWTGELLVTDALDERAASHTRTVERGAGDGRIWAVVEAEGSGVTAALVSVVHGPGSRGGGGPGHDGPLPARDGTASRTIPATASQTIPATASRTISVHTSPGRPLTFTKYVSVVTSHTADRPLSTARAHADEAAREGHARLAEDNRRAWQREWEGDIVVRGDALLQRRVRASKFYLLTSAHEDSPWSPSPCGLSSDGYNGHVFWDTETWIWPSLLAQHPRLARSALDYRVARLDAARAAAAAEGHRGARFPWESGLTGDEDTPGWVPFGDLELHVSADVALAFWQYWLATGDHAWLRTAGLPVLSAVADFWADRVTADADGRCHINGVIPPDEYAVEPKDDSVYTNVAARDALRFAALAAEALGVSADPRWAETADRIVVPFDEALGIHPEFTGYEGQTIKQADVVMLAYPWENPQPPEVTRADLEYYAPRTDEDGPSMTDSVHSIVLAELGDAEAAFEYTRRSVEPFVRPPFEQFAEDRAGGAFTFLTGHGGFLQEFLYGYSGLRRRTDRVVLAPILPGSLDGITLRRLRWQGRVFDVDIRHDGTTVRLHTGEPLPVETAGTLRQVPAGGEVMVATRTSTPYR